MATATRLESRIEEYWSWAAVALYLLVTVDLLTTMFAAAELGIALESNPLMAWLLTRPLWVIVGVNLVAVVLAGVFFYGLMQTLRRTPSPYDRYLAGAVEAWLGGLVAAGLLVFTNNLAVIVLGRSLLG